MKTFSEYISENDYQPERIDIGKAKTKPIKYTGSFTTFAKVIEPDERNSSNLQKFLSKANDKMKIMKLIKSTDYIVNYDKYTTVIPDKTMKIDKTQYKSVVLAIVDNQLITGNMMLYTIIDEEGTQKDGFYININEVPDF